MVSTTRCMFECEMITKYPDDYEKVNLRAQYNTHIPMEKRFAEASPSGSFEIFITNPNVYGFFKPGTKYYLDIQEVPEAEKENVY